jgi:hypothetical protein
VIPGAAHIDLGRTIVGLLLFLLFAVSLNGAVIAPFVSPDPELRVRCILAATVLWILAFLDALRLSGLIRKPIRAGGDVFAAAPPKPPGCEDSSPALKK